MRISSAGRFVFIAQWVLAVVLPVWLFLGRGLVGAELGWLVVLGFLYGIVVIAVLLIPPVLTLFDRTVRTGTAVRTGYAVSSFVLWGALLLASLAVPDASDAPGGLRPALTVWTGGAISIDAATAVFGVASVVIGLAYAATLVLAVAGIFRARTELAPPPRTLAP
jgi:hypothetical protein